MSDQLSSGLSLKDDIASIWTDPTFHDVIIVCSDGVEIGACRAVLASRSSFFRAMLYGNMQEAMSNKINLRNIKSTALHTVLQFIHTENIHSTDNSVAMDVYYAANYLLLPKLMELVMERVHDMRLLEVSTSLLNETAALPAENENIDERYNILRPFYTHSLAVGDLNGLTEDALELLLVRFSKMTTPEYDLLLCVIEWAWSRNATAQSATERHAIFDAVNRMPVEPRPRILLGSGPSRTSLLKMIKHINLALICPHRLQFLIEAVDVLAETALPYRSLFRNACKSVRCSASHPSELCGISKPGFQWSFTLTSELFFSEEYTVVDMLSGSMNWFSTARASTPCVAGPNGLCEWDIIVESIDSYSSRNMIGFVSESFDKFEQHSIANQWGFGTMYNSSYGHIYTKGDYSTKDYGPAIHQGDIVTFHLNLGDRTCEISINGTNYGIAWTNLPRNEKLYPAVTLNGLTKYRIRPHGQSIFL